MVGIEEVLHSGRLGFLDMDDKKDVSLLDEDTLPMNVCVLFRVAEKTTSGKADGVLCAQGFSVVVCRCW